MPARVVLRAAVAVGAAVVLGGCSTAPAVVSVLHRPRSSVPRDRVYVAGLSVRAPADEPVAAVAACARAPRAVGWARREEALRGTSAWRRTGTDAGPVVAYLSSDSVACGDRLLVHLDGPPSLVSLVAYRIGWYGGAGGREISRLDRVRVVPHPQAVAPSHSTSRETWPVTAAVPVTRAWTPGLYLLDVVQRGHVDDAVPFVVRDESRSAPTVVLASVLTWFAYDDWGGRSLYRGPGRTPAAAVAARAYRASTDRPLVGDGMSQFLLRDLPLAHELGRIGLDAAYVTDLDVDRRPSLLAGRADVVLAGHSEYWTARMLDAAEAARDSGTNVAVLGANAVYWQARVDTQPAGSWITVYRSTALDPLGRTPAATTRWRAWPVLRSGAQLEGESYTGIGTFAGVRVLHTPAWLFAGSLVHAGQLVPRLGANEFDGRSASDPAAPPSVEPLLAGAVRAGGHYALMTTVYWVAPSGAGVFAAGTTAWTCDLDASCAEGRPSSTAMRLVRTLTDRVLLAFAAPRAGVRHPAVAAVAPTPAQVSAMLPPSLVGRLGVDP